MRKVITYGTYDLFHQGHLNLLEKAKALGDYLIVGVTSDNFDLDRGKLNVRHSVLQRIEAVKNTGLADEIVIEDYIGQKIDDIQRYGVDIFAIGSDWEGKFDYLNEYCRVIYLPRTEGISSTQLRAESQNTYKIGVIGSGRIAQRFVPESEFVSSVRVSAVFNPDESEAIAFANKFSIEHYSSDLHAFLQVVDCVYVASPHLSHYEYSKQALLANKHVLCEIPLVLSEAESKELYDIASERNLVLLEASKTAFCPAFIHLNNMIKSGVIGQVVDVQASLSKLQERTLREFDSLQAGGSFTELAPLPIMAIIKILGMKMNDVEFYSRIDNQVDIYTKAIFKYDAAIATITLGLGVKTEGNLVISGTKGYVYVPAPWWKTEYFELRFEDQNLNRKFFYPFFGDGLRYEIQEFISMIDMSRIKSFKLNPDESILISSIIEKYISKTKVVLLNG